ncbi:hypothetical protein HNQ02_002855 [Flavobacterium sp. 7E]|uniref:hypothetical protein n=1 Tax=Flavobacterium sp. 7E TaxID=2735898 RepID=UPI001571265E|nr:hypothetical protein [Flavobacterium sp. 7E]NRS89921.1 hypothetical protein [Flavobacterium sp. 7E]
MSRIRIVGGTITKTTIGAHHMYSDENIVFSSSKMVTEVGDENGVVYGEPKDAPKIKTDKKVIDMYWTYGDTKLSDKSRFYVDMNLTVKTQNYSKGENVTVIVKNEDGEQLTDDLNELSLTGIVDENNMVIFEAILKDYTLNLLEKDDLE